MTSDQALRVARRYHDGWTSRNYEQAIDLLAPTLQVEVPINDYPTADSFAQALRSFGALVTSVELLSQMSDGEAAILLYDMHVEPLGTLRVAEHFTVADGKIVRLRQIHDTAPVRAAGFGPAVEAAGAPPMSDANSSDVYELEAQFAVPRERVFDALTTLGGLAAWWTSLVTGTPTSRRGNRVRLRRTRGEDRDARGRGNTPIDGHLDLS